MLVLENIRKRFKDFELYIEKLEFYDNEYAVIVAPSGSGKTTTLRIIAGLETPDEGRVILDGEDITNLPPWKRNIGIVFQNYALYPHLTALENIAMPLKIKGLDSEEIHEKVIEIAKILEIEKILDKYPSQLSGGQQQRVALARALVKEPKVLLLDEPLSNIDARLKLDLRGFLKSVQRRLHMTAIHVTHDQEEAMAIGDRIVIINEGRIEQVGTPVEVYNRPKTLFVYNFVGLSNLLPGSMFGFSDNVIVGFRPENVMISLTEDTGLKAEVLTIQYLGSHNLIELRVGEHTIKARTSFELPVKEKETVYIKIPREKMLLFDKKGGELIK
ncbi:ABC transporter ATP-binding protein [Thermococcus sp. Bubb.Bath]|uniref:ABC transporter ATP-binding protein n=1 Tax=Thermococcus sp. Bubb.Bath TaxID=1638242 RepID=UPI001438F167|nr:ABC transporter ATP-binding protein [Thermococcus sp. Bubb.Bath]NJF25748.1 ABC transporter ATP-binding protein [Thermococcus sp. Bubb.Bath]